MSGFDFNAMMARDMARAAGGPTGEVVTFHPRDGSPVALGAIVERLGRVPDEQGGFVMDVCRIAVPRATVDSVGVSRFFAGDVFELAPEIGGPVKRLRVVDVETQDEGGFLVQCTA